MDGSCRFVFVFYLCRLATIDLEENPLARAPSAGPRQKSSLGVIFGDGDGGDDDDGETDTNKSLEAIICPSQSFGCLCLPLSTAGRQLDRLALAKLFNNQSTCLLDWPKQPSSWPAQPVSFRRRVTDWPRFDTLRCSSREEQ